MATKAQIGKWIKEGKVVWVAGLHEPYEVEIIYRGFNQSMVQSINKNNYSRVSYDHRRICETKEQALHMCIVLLKKLCDQRWRDLDDKFDRLQSLIDKSTEYEYLKEFWSKDLSFLPHVYKLMKYKKENK